MPDQPTLHVISADGLSYAAELHPAGVVCACGLVAYAVPVVVRGGGAEIVAERLRRQGYEDVREETAEDAQRIAAEVAPGSAAVDGDSFYDQQPATATGQMRTQGQE